jgi:hypothetical protein
MRVFSLLALCVLVLKVTAATVVPPEEKKGWRIVNMTGDTVSITMGNQSRKTPPGRDEFFMFGSGSRVLIEIRKEDGTLILSKEYEPSLDPNDHSAVVNPDFTFTDIGGDPGGKKLKQHLKYEDPWNPTKMQLRFFPILAAGMSVFMLIMGLLMFSSHYVNVSGCGGLCVLASPIAGIVFPLRYLYLAIRSGDILAMTISALVLITVVAVIRFFWPTIKEKLK